VSLTPNIHPNSRGIRYMSYIIYMLLSIYYFI